MAKLEDVKMVEIVDGVVNKIEYSGQVYEKIECDRGDIEVGDIVQNRNNRADADKGNYYEVIEHDFFETTVLDDVDEVHSDLLHDCEVFRNVGDIVKHEGETYRRIASKDVETGDIVRFPLVDTDTVAGKFYEVVEGRSYIDEDGVRLLVYGWGGYEKAEVFRKVDESKDAEDGQLLGVEVVEMRDGEIVKIAYKGDDYEFTGEEEERGDIALIETPWGRQKAGEYYRVIKEEHFMYANDSDEFVHIQGKTNHASASRDYVKLFRKAVDSLVGKSVKVTKCKYGRREGYTGYGLSGQGLVATGSIGIVVKEEPEAGGIYVSFDEDTTTSLLGAALGSFFLADGEFEIIGCGEATKEDGGLKIGDFAKIVSLEATEECRGLTSYVGVGDVVELIGESNKTYSKGFKVKRVGDEEVRPFENNIVAKDLALLTDKEQAEHKFARGTKVRVIVPEDEDTRFSRVGVTNDEIGTVEIVRLALDDAPVVDVTFPSYGEGWTGLPEELEALSAEEANPFEKGDIVKVVGATFFDDIEKGEYAIVSNGSNYADGDLRIETLSGDDYDYVEPEAIEKIEAGEREMSFIRAGRQIDELKTGDIVEIVYDVGGHPEGTIGAVVGGIHNVEANGKKWSHSIVKLVAPASSRTDIKLDE